MATRAATARQTGIAVVDAQVTLQLIRFACKEAPDTVQLYMDHEVAPSEPASDVWAQLGGHDIGPGESELPGADIRAVSFDIDVHSAGVAGGQRTNDNTLTGTIAAIMGALECRSFTSTPTGLEPAGDHVLEIGRCRADRMVDQDLRPLGIVRLTFTGKVTRDSGDGMVTIPTS